MKAHNLNMKELLKANGIDASVKLIEKGSLKGSWRLYNKDVTWYGNKALQSKLTELGFLGYFGKPLNDFEGNGGVFMVFLRYNGSAL